MMVNDLQSFINLFKNLRRERKVLNWGEFAEQIEYDRTYISRVINGHEPFTQDIADAANKKFTKNVVPDYKDLYLSALEDLRDKDKTLSEIKESLSKLSSAVAELSELHKEIDLASLSTLGKKSVENLDKKKGSDSGNDKWGKA